MAYLSDEDSSSSGSDDGWSEEESKSTPSTGAGAVAAALDVPRSATAPGARSAQRVARALTLARAASASDVASTAFLVAESGVGDTTTTDAGGSGGGASAKETASRRKRPTAWELQRQRDLHKVHLLTLLAAQRHASRVASSTTLQTAVKARIPDELFAELKLRPLLQASPEGEQLATMHAVRLLMNNFTFAVRVDEALTRLRSAAVADITVAADGSARSGAASFALTAKSVARAVSKGEGTEAEVVVAFVALLRALRIPTRLVWAYPASAPGHSKPGRGAADRKRRRRTVDTVGAAPARAVSKHASERQHRMAQWVEVYCDATLAAAGTASARTSAEGNGGERRGAATRARNVGARGARREPTKDSGDEAIERASARRVAAKRRRASAGGARQARAASSSAPSASSVRWVHVDPIRDWLDEPKRCERGVGPRKRRFVYVTAVEAGGHATDVTVRYAARASEVSNQRRRRRTLEFWPSLLGRERCKRQSKRHRKSQIAGRSSDVAAAGLRARARNSAIPAPSTGRGAGAGAGDGASHTAGTATGDGGAIDLTGLGDTQRPVEPGLATAAAVQQRRDAEEAELHMRELQEPVPSSRQAFRKHPVYVLEEDLGRHEVLRPREPVVAEFKGRSVHLRDNVRSVQQPEYWLKQGRRVRAEELGAPAKIVPGRKRRRRAGAGAGGSGDSEADRAATPDVRLYGKWQTEVLVPEPVVEGVIPTNQYGMSLCSQEVYFRSNKSLHCDGIGTGNVEVWHPRCVPHGAVHVGGAYALRAAKSIGVPYARAMVGFDHGKGGAHAVFDGVVVLSAHECAFRERHSCMSPTLTVSLLCLPATVRDAAVVLEQSKMERTLAKAHEKAVEESAQSEKQRDIAARLREEYGSDDARGDLEAEVVDLVSDAPASDEGDSLDK